MLTITKRKIGFLFILISSFLVFLWLILELTIFSTDIVEINGYFSDYIIYGFLLAPILLIIGLGLFYKGSFKFYLKSAAFLIVWYILIFVIYLYFNFTFCSWTINGIKYEHKTNENLRIISREFGCGAVDGTPATKTDFKLYDYSPYLTIISKCNYSEIDFNEWIKVKVPYLVWLNNRNGSYVSREYFIKFLNELNKKSKINFPYKNLKSFTGILGNVDEYPKIKYWRIYCDNTLNDNFKTYIFYSNKNTLTLRTLNKSNVIDEMEIMRIFETDDYAFHKFTKFTSNNEFTVYRSYKNKPINKSKELLYINKYKINNSGEIIKITGKIFGEIRK